MNIRNAADRETLTKQGYTWVTVRNYEGAERKGEIQSRHKSYEAARQAAKDTNRAIVEVAYGDTF